MLMPLFALPERYSLRPSIGNTMFNARLLFAAARLPRGLVPDLTPAGGHNRLHGRRHPSCGTRPSRTGNGAAGW